jgi:hypothetical protein
VCGRLDGTSVLGSARWNGSRREQSLGTGAIALCLI